MNAPLRVFYGGSFDPVHNGHLAIARAARDALDARVFLVPAGDPPHKSDTCASAEQRARMLDLAIEGEPGLAVDGRELLRPGPSYTVDTLRELRADLGAAAAIAWLVGADSLRQLQTWHRWRRLFDLAHLLVVERPDAALDAAALHRDAPEVLDEITPRLCAPSTLAARPSGGCCVLPLAQLRPESSSALRLRIARGDARWRDWVPPAVAAHIVMQGLYGVSAGILPRNL
ncbi:MAG: nicotinate-nucleotide adenylyltransferase [Thermomonas sp.]|uniref:nicotinate-nucleotide adenylyltransferase n=1 Tax=Thermomonas sp. TaxID=1971895 RepID=UPI00262891E1|nr:nicotinate-nucleotide adenylyltransferase [Thermomonas sp.]MCC7097924.1 nicotinate-nucleotide adenylyltransferase [Thermomonas sp.]